MLHFTCFQRSLVSSRVRQRRPARGSGYTLFCLLFYLYIRLISFCPLFLLRRLMTCSPICFSFSKLFYSFNSLGQFISHVWCFWQVRPLSYFCSNYHLILWFCYSEFYTFSNCSSFTKIHG